MQYLGEYFMKLARDWRCYRLARLGRNSLLQGRDLGQADGLEAPSLVETEQDEPAVRHVPEGAQGLAERGHAAASGLHLNGRGVSATAAESVDERGQIDIDDILIDVVLVRSTVISTESMTHFFQLQQRHRTRTRALDVTQNIPKRRGIVMTQRRLIKRILHFNCFFSHFYSFLF